MSGDALSIQGRTGAIQFAGTDDVAIVTADVAVGGMVKIAGRGDIVAVDAIARGHKIAIRDVEADRPVRKYGEIIGFASRRITAGQLVHTQNLEYREFERSAVAGSARADAPTSVEGSATFQGFVRADGRVGTRNYIGILTSVNCSATVARLAARAFQAQGALDAFPHVDGVIALTHALGCCQGGAGLDLLQRTLRGYARHPNFGAVIVLGLGCEGNQVGDLIAGIRSADARPIEALRIQDLGGTAATVQQAVASVTAMLPEVERARRQTVPASELVVAMECGGSDAYSGLTANPAVGAAGDLVAAQGGTFVFGETPEIYGAEHLLVARASSDQVADRLRDRIRWWEEYVRASGGSMDNNPTPGNREGGITTILEKSLGAIAKGGRSDLAQVCEYAESITSKGLVFMDTPGYDPVSVTGMVAGGANMVCFTTGRGSVFGCKPVPSIKVATNTPMFLRLAGDMDVNAGRIFDGETSVPALGQELFDLILRIASGEPTLSETLGFGEEEFSPWQIGAVM